MTAPEMPQEVVSPPANTVVTRTTGEYEYVELVNSWIQEMLAEHQFEIIDGSLPHAARYDIVTTAQLVASRDLEFFGQRELQYTAAITIRAVDVTDGTVVGGPHSQTVDYTAINLEANLKQATRSLVRALIRDLTEHVPDRP